MASMFGLIVSLFLIFLGVGLVSYRCGMRSVKHRKRETRVFDEDVIRQLLTVRFDNFGPGRRASSHPAIEKVPCK